MTIRRRASCSATIAPRWSRYSSMWRAGARRRTCREAGRGPQRPWYRTASHRRDDPALLVSDAVVMAAAGRTRLLAHLADRVVGISADLHRAECGLLRSGRRHLYRRGHAVGHPVPRSARLFHLLP